MTSQPEPENIKNKSTPQSEQEHEHNKHEQTNGHFQIHYFAAASDYVGKPSESLPAPLALSQLFPVLESKYPGIREKVLKSCGVSVGFEYVDVEDDGGRVVIGIGEEVAIIPPVSSG